MMITWPLDMTLPARQLVVKAATWSRMAYTSAPMFPNVRRVDVAESDAHCLVLGPETHGDDRLLVIAVRGTTSYMDAICDVEVNQVLLDAEEDGMCARAMVHGGFHKQFVDLNASIHLDVTRHLVTGGRLWCTGHSLGAGVASLFAVHYGARFPEGQVAFSGYGTPRSGNAAFSQLMQVSTSSAVCVKNHRDPVCASIPPVCIHVSSLSLCYEYAGKPVCIGHDPQPDLANPLFIRDHDIATYVRNLGGDAAPVPKRRRRLALLSATTAVIGALCRHVLLSSRF